ncbi:MAG: ATP-binding cassette domain-containing protein [Candidatus Bathyarchaeia archaeon]
MLEVVNLDVYYGDLHILWGLNFKAKDKQITAVIGPNGAGKTTLCKTIVGLVSPKSGSIIFESEKINHLSPVERIRKGITILPEGRRLFSNLSVKENLELAFYPFKEENARPLRAGFQHFPHFEGTSKSTCWQIEWWSTADACHRKGSCYKSKIADNR